MATLYSKMALHCTLKLKLSFVKNYIIISSIYRIVIIQLETLGVTSGAAINVTKLDLRNKTVIYIPSCSARLYSIRIERNSIIIIHCFYASHRSVYTLSLFEWLFNH